MFTRVVIDNFKSFLHLDLDLSKNRRSAKEIIAIYGENGGGKTNLVSVFMNLALSLQTMTNQKRSAELQAELMADTDDGGDGDSLDKSQLLREYIRTQGMPYSTIVGVFKNAYTIDEVNPMRIRYEFVIDEHKGFYELVFKREGDTVYLASEELNFLLKQSRGRMFKISRDTNNGITPYFSPSLFDGNMKLTDLLSDEITRVWGKHTLLAIFNNLAGESNERYIQDNTNVNFLEVLNTFKRIAFRTDGVSGVNSFTGLLDDLLRGEIADTASEKRKLMLSQETVNKYFVPLYSDIINLFYKVKKDSSNKIDYVLYEKKRIGGKLVEIPFSSESHGTRELLGLLPLLLNAVHGETVIIDEIDQGIHDLLIDRLIDNVKEDLRGQLIFTTHDTQVMQQLEPSSLYIIQSDVDGNKRVEALSRAAHKGIAAHNNIQKKYIEGYFAGIPYADDVDFEDIVRGLEVGQ
ncbi:AAA family ATPase [Levilactobacillus parabrevis]|uniref:ATPase AAA-type core domain-containing protein n=1 Tax=Levilactobacillus parabrevis ATCC 53295 TaxID=1267003 RepID=A0A0R1GMB4_9LACO|nr:AAA family ATPase [Levilactobacillus parabrevis]KRK34905.1 hypothetical protein FD07_GL001664 [Levilactobacillus parabrevis ATCC 53295]KRO05045.1 hypothetical protein IV61_GL001747 [Levilactobacillus parabrevis]